MNGLEVQRSENEALSPDRERAGRVSCVLSIQYLLGTGKIGGARLPRR